MEKSVGERALAPVPGYDVQRADTLDEALAHDGAVIGDAAGEDGRTAQGVLSPNARPTRGSGRGVVEEEGSCSDVLLCSTRSAPLAGGRSRGGYCREPRSLGRWPLRAWAIGPSNDACPGRRLDGRHQGCPIGGLASVDWLRVAQLDAAHPVSLPVVGNQQVVIGAIPEQIAGFSAEATVLGTSTTH